jgi:hypothetical protein
MHRPAQADLVMPISRTSPGMAERDLFLPLGPWSSVSPETPSLERRWKVMRLVLPTTARMQHATGHRDWLPRGRGVRVGNALFSTGLKDASLHLRQ